MEPEPIKLKNKYTVAAKASKSPRGKPLVVNAKQCPQDFGMSLREEDKPYWRNKV